MSDEKTSKQLDKKLKSSKPPKPPKKVKRGTVIHEPQRSVRHTNIFRDRLIVLSGNINAFLGLALLASAGLNAWIITQPNLPSPFFIQYVTGQIAPITLYPKERLPPPMPLDIQPLSAHARLDENPVYLAGSSSADQAAQQPAQTAPTSEQQAPR